MCVLHNPPWGGLHGFSAALWHQSGEMADLFVMQTPIASCLIQMSALAHSPLPHSRFTLHPRLQSPLSASPSLSSPSKSACREKREPPRAEAVAEADLPPGGQPVSQCVGLFPGPTETISYSNVTIRPLTHWGLFMAAAPRSQGQDGDLIAPAEERSGGAKWFRGWMSNKKAFFLSCHVNFNPYSPRGSRHSRDVPQLPSSRL